MSNVKVYKLRKIFNIALIILFIFVAFIIYALYTIMNIDIIYGETGELMKFSEKLTFFILASIAALTWFISLLIMLRQKFIIKKAYSLTKEGIEDMLMGGIILAFIIVVPIKLIPWKCIILDKENTLIKIDVKNIPNTSFLVKTILKVKSINQKIVDKDFISFYDKYTSEKEIF